MYIFSI
jgi:hypothetical protein